MHRMYTVAMARYELRQLLSRQVLMHRDPRPVRIHASSDEGRVGAAVGRSDDLQMRCQIFASNRCEDADDLFEPLFRGYPANTHKPVLAPLPWHSGEAPCYRRMHRDRLNAVQCSNPGAHKLRADNGQVASHPLHREASETRCETTIKIGDPSRPVVPS